MISFELLQHIPICCRVLRLTGCPHICLLFLNLIDYLDPSAAGDERYANLWLVNEQQREGCWVFGTNEVPPPPPPFPSPRQGCVNLTACTVWVLTWRYSTASCLKKCVFNFCLQGFPSAVKRLLPVACS